MGQLLFLGLGYRRWLCWNTFFLLNTSHHLLVRIGTGWRDDSRRASHINTNQNLNTDQNSGHRCHRNLCAYHTTTYSHTNEPYVLGCRYACIFHHTRELHLQLGIPYALSVALGPISLISWFRNRTRRRPSSTKLMCYHRRIPRFSLKLKYCYLKYYILYHIKCK